MSLSSPQKITPQSHQVQTANFFHLYWDVAWYGIAYGSTLSFLAVFAARLDAAGWQIGLLTAGPALVNALITLPAGRWLENRSLSRAVVQTAVWQRVGFFLMIPLPLLLPDSLKVWSVLILSLLMAVPGTALAIGFNALLAATVPPESRGRVVGWRNSLLAATVMIAFVLSGWILDWLTFEWGYAVVFYPGRSGGRHEHLPSGPDPGSNPATLSDATYARPRPAGARRWFGGRRPPTFKCHLASVAALAAGIGQLD
ncbi:MAG: MFS transporter [Anaerolineales bacterium]|nr:MFS transporter [Anaerolineales bacterium]